FGAPQRIQGIVVRIVDARLESLPATPGEESAKPTQALLVRVRIENLAVSREVPFDGWYKQNSTPAVRLTDDRQKKYQFMDFPGPMEAGSPKLRADGKTNHDLAFEPPDLEARTLYLELPGQRLGFSEPFRFEIPVAQIRRPTTPAGAAPGAPPASDKDK